MYFSKNVISERNWGPVAGSTDILRKMTFFENQGIFQLFSPKSWRAPQNSLWNMSRFLDRFLSGSEPRFGANIALTRKSHRAHSGC